MFIRIDRFNLYKATIILCSFNFSFEAKAAFDTSEIFSRENIEIREVNNLNYFDADEDLYYKPNIRLLDEEIPQISLKRFTVQEFNIEKEKIFPEDTSFHLSPENTSSEDFIIVSKTSVVLDTHYEQSMLDLLRDEDFKRSYYHDQEIRFINAGDELKLECCQEYGFPKLSLGESIITCFSLYQFYYGSEKNPACEEVSLKKPELIRLLHSNVHKDITKAYIFTNYAKDSEIVVRFDGDQEDSGGSDYCKSIHYFIPLSEEKSLYISYKVVHLKKEERYSSFKYRFAGVWNKINLDSELTIRGELVQGMHNLNSYFR